MCISAVSDEGVVDSALLCACVCVFMFHVHTSSLPSKTEKEGHEQVKKMQTQNLGGNQRRTGHFMPKAAAEYSLNQNR